MGKMFEDSAEYWESEMDSNFGGRDELNKNQFFVIGYEGSPLDGYFHTVMNFENFEKMHSYIKWLILRPAVADALDLGFAGRDFYEQVGEAQFRENMTRRETDAIEMWKNFDGIMNLEGEKRGEALEKYRKRFNRFFKSGCRCTYGFEVVKPGRSLTDFWKKFFKLESDDEELQTVSEAIETGDTELLDDALSYHC